MLPASRIGVRVGNNIRVLMARTNIKASTVADVCRVTPQTVCNWRRGRAVPNVRTLLALSVLFHVGVADLLEVDQ